MASIHSIGSIMFENDEGLRKGLYLLNKVFERFGLKINMSKTKTMIINHVSTTSSYPDSIASLNGEKIDNVEEFA